MRDNLSMWRHLPSVLLGFIIINYVCTLCHGHPVLGHVCEHDIPASTFIRNEFFALAYFWLAITDIFMAKKMLEMLVAFISYFLYMVWSSNLIYLQIFVQNVQKIMLGQCDTKNFTRQLTLTLILVTGEESINT